MMEEMAPTVELHKSSTLMSNLTINYVTFQYYLKTIMPAKTLQYTFLDGTAQVILTIYENIKSLFIHQKMTSCYRCILIDGGILYVF